MVAAFVAYFCVYGFRKPFTAGTYDTDGVWGLGFNVVVDPAAMAANATLTPGSFGHGGAHGTNSWADPTRGLIYVFMIQRAGLENADDSPMRRAYQQAVATALRGP